MCRNLKNRIVSYVNDFFLEDQAIRRYFSGLKIAGIPDIDTFYIARFDSISSRLENQDSNIFRISTFQNLIFFLFFFFKLRKILMNISEGEIEVREEGLKLSLGGSYCYL